MKQYYRIFTDLLPKALFKAGKSIDEFLVVFMFVLLIGFSYLAFLLFKQYQVMQSEKLAQVGELKYWENVVKERPNFSDAYYNAAIFSYRLSQKDKAIEYLKKAIDIDPGFKDAEVFIEEISKNK